MTNAISIATAAMLIDLRMSVWTARKKDKNTEAQVIHDSNARSSKAASVHKHLLADAEPLMAIARYTGDCRQWLYLHTLPWSDNGQRMLPTKDFFSFKQEANQRENHFWQLVGVFDREYPVLITSMALQLGSLFNRNEYPDPRTITDKFGWQLTFSPVPEAGDFRVDVPADALKELKNDYAREADRRVEQAMRDAWTRLHETITHMKEKLTPSDDGKTKRLHETMLINAGELCAVLTSLNIMGDPKLEEARRKLEQIVETTDTQSLRESDELRESVKKKLDEINDKFAL
jgi:hypothetical protein